MKPRAPLRFSLPLTGAVALGLLAVGGGALVLRESRLARQERAALDQVRQEREWLARQSPAPTPENEAALADEVKRLRQATLAWGQAWPVEAEAAQAGEKSVDLYFDLAAFAEAARTQAIRAGVEVKLDERFGFASYARTGPAVDGVAAVRRQRRDLQGLVESLVEARPVALFAVQRERPAGLAAAADDVPADYFAGGPSRPGGRRYRLEFTGQTAALRNFVTALAVRREPVLVRQVEVVPLAAGAAAPGPAQDTAVPVVAENLSRFAVVVEWIDPASVVPPS